VRPAQRGTRRTGTLGATLDGSERGYDHPNLAGRDLLMMGKTHAASGWCAGLALARLVGIESLSETLVFAATTAGWALGPDLDHPGARASRLLGPVTGGLSWLLRRASSALYAATKGPRDENHNGTHRHLSHTVLFAGAVGGLTAAGVAVGGPWVVAGVVLFGVLLAADALGDWLLLVALGAGVLLAATTDVWTALTAVGGWLWIAVTLGCITHCLGDALTLSGCPFLFPLPIAGETWYEIRPPRPLRFRTGGDFETRAVFPVFAVLGVLLIPGVWSTGAAAIRYLVDRNTA
jgi:hypothetical protein